jgi:adenosine deaminase
MVSPKIELHCHFEGTASPALIRRLARRNDIDLPAGLFNDHGGFAWTTFLEFLRAYDLASTCIRTTLDYRDVMYDYLKSCAAEGAVYVEMFSSPDHAAATGMSYSDHVEGMSQGIDDAERDFGIIARIIVTCVRHLGPDSALDVANAMVSEPHPYVVGFGMGGDENQYQISDFAPAFDRVSRSGLPTTVHAGEVNGPHSVAQTLDILPISRIGHGVRAAEDPALLERIAKAGLTLEICTGSNLALGLYSLDTHPLNVILQAGCRVALGSDDPPYFETSIGAEYERAQNHFGLGSQGMEQLNQRALEAAFCDEETRHKLRSRLSP